MIRKQVDYTKRYLTLTFKGINMWTIELNWITGFMLGMEFLTKEQTDGTTAFIMDLGIVRFGIYHEDF